MGAAAAATTQRECGHLRGIPVPIPLDQFIQHVVDSTLMSAAEVAALIDSLPADKKPQDGAELARELVRQKKLTAHQAQQIYAGKPKTLVMGNCVILDKLGEAAWAWYSRPSTGG
jgi:hypothetical protein